MKTAKLINGTQKRRYLLDKTSEYYRECPQCFEEFMADHMSQKFCNDKCGDDFNNAKKRLAHHSINNDKSQIIQDSKAIITTQSDQTPLQKNLSVLRSFFIDPINGSYFHLEDLDEKGFDFTAVAGKGKLHNIPTEYNSHFIQIGEYRIFRVEFSNVLIVKTNNK
jgi:hypothetical protein